MKIIKEIVVGVVAGLIIGLPQGMRDLPMTMADNLPRDTVLIIAVFGAVGGLAFGMKFLSRANRKEYSIGGYVFFLVGSLSIGIPTIIRHYNGSFIQDLTMPGLFFTSIGFAMILGGGLSHAFSKTT